MNSQQRVVEYLLEEASQTCNLDARNGSGVAAIEYLAKVYPEKCKELVRIVILSFFNVLRLNLTFFVHTKA